MLALQLFPNHLGLLYRVSYQLTYLLFQPIHLIGVDRRTENVYIIAGNREELELQIVPSGEVF